MLSVFQHLEVDTKTLSKQKHDAWDGLDCLFIGMALSLKNSEYVSRLMVAQRNQVEEAAKTAGKTNVLTPSGWLL